MLIDKYSYTSIRIGCYFNENKIGDATGFILEAPNNRKYLVTNLHVVSGKNSDTGKNILKSGAIPNKLIISMPVRELTQFGYAWKELAIDLYTKENKRVWIQSNERLAPNAPMIDIALIAFKGTYTEKIHSIELSLKNTDMILYPSEPVSIIGFPYGKSSTANFAIWKTGHIASDLDIDYKGMPMFLIDSTTRTGMSGSPVIAIRNGPYQNSKGYQYIGGRIEKFLGVYSGRINAESELGRVWKPKAIEQILVENGFI